jgi:pimeloyl-ACP methyl ester carboxylesterase
MLQSRPVATTTRTWLEAAATALDRAVVDAVRWRNRARPSRADSLSHVQRMEALAYIEKAYGDPALLATPDAFFPPPPPILPELTRVLRPGQTTRVFDASWPSGYEPFLPEISAKYAGHRRNATAHARLFFGQDAAPRPVAILIHGYLGGYWVLEERAFPVRWLLRRGLDVALFVLPFHALRAREDRPAPPPFPGADPRFVNEGFRQTISDLRGLVAWLMARGAPSVGVMGMSLGGYTTALAATVLGDHLSFAVPMIPLASIADFAREQGRLGEGSDAEEEHRALDAATRVVSPFTRPSRLAKERVLVLAGDGDRITPMNHAERIARHLGGPIVHFPGGHLLQFGRSDAFREVGAWLRGLGVMS